MSSPEQSELSRLSAESYQSAVEAAVEDVDEVADAICRWAAEDGDEAQAEPEAQAQAEAQAEAEAEPPLPALVEKAEGVEAVGAVGAVGAAAPDVTGAEVEAEVEGMQQAEEEEEEEEEEAAAAAAAQQEEAAAAAERVRVATECLPAAAALAGVDDEAELLDLALEIAAQVRHTSTAACNPATLQP